MPYQQQSTTGSRLGHVKSEPVLALHHQHQRAPVQGEAGGGGMMEPLRGGGRHAGGLAAVLDAREEYSSSPPVRMRTDPKDLLAPLQPNPGGNFQAPGAYQASAGFTSNSGLTRSNSIPKMQTSQQMYRSHEHISQLSDPRGDHLPVNKSRGSFHEYNNHQNPSNNTEQQFVHNNNYHSNHEDARNKLGRDGHKGSILDGIPRVPSQTSLREKPNTAIHQEQHAPQQRRIEDVVQPLSTLRLRPIRQKTKNAVANILASGEVCMEFISTKKRGNTPAGETIHDVMRISGDGQRVAVYNLGKEGAPITDVPTPYPTGGADTIYGYGTLPEKMWKKYTYAARFVNLVKAKTPKITLYDSKSKSYLMENEPDPDFETYFNNGVKVSYSNSSVKFINSKGTNHSFNYPFLDRTTIPPECEFYLEHFQSCQAHCQRIESLLGQDTSTSGLNLPVFPIIIGRKPTKDDKQPQYGGVDDEATNSSLEKENRAPPINNLRSFQGTIMSEMVGGDGARQPPGSHQRQQQYSVSSTHQQTVPNYRDIMERFGGGGVGSHSRSVRSDLSRTLHIPGIGTARLHKDNSVQVNYDDEAGSALRLRTGADNLDYLESAKSAGGWTTYSHSNLPPHVKQKLAQIPQILQRLMSSKAPC
eukprot:TRINITY_DN21131_c0_g2_i4.p1 TRINITY_DN21131_c0_g2~~TRINITY_DN21131_c0_g2_i4.p1  ORF type:complete len:753 (+),score=121.68 TRINITY_DN21131_c0_g2_i4:331-2259(+)